MKKQKALTQCSYCGALQLKKFFLKKWIDYKIPVIRSGNVSHGICPECFKKQMAELEEV
jgi:hypothetical protein